MRAGASRHIQFLNCVGAACCRIEMAHDSGVILPGGGGAAQIWGACAPCGAGGKKMHVLVDMMGDHTDFM